jgi:DNA-binding MarR family transcriptional regulator
MRNWLAQMLDKLSRKYSFLILSSDKHSTATVGAAMPVAVTGQIDIRLTHSIRARTRLFISNVSRPSRQTSDYVLDESVGYLLGRVRSTMWNMVTQQTMADLGITATQACIIFMLVSGRSLIAADLAREYGIDASAVTRLVDRLEKRGLLLRVRSNADRRMVKLALTAQGVEVAERVPEIFTRVLDVLLARFTSEEIGFLKSMLRRIMTNSEDSASAALPGMSVGLAERDFTNHT